MRDPNSTVTVYIVTKNRRKLLERAIESVLRQDYADIELIVVDDGSVDDTPSYLHHLAELKLLRLITNAQSRGACYSRNRAIETACGYWVTGLDDDDFFAPSRISAFVRRWKSGETRSALYSDIKVMELRGVRVRCLPDSASIEDLKRRNVIGPQIFTRASYLREIGGFNLDLPAWQDYETWFRLITHYGPAENIGIPTYTLDVSHGFHRISTDVARRYNEACEIFLHKHGDRFSVEEREIFRLNMLMYPQVSFGLDHVRSAFSISSRVGGAYLAGMIIKKLYSLGINRSIIRSGISRA